jgi:hypothetical protein
MPQSAYPAKPQVTAPAVSFEAVQGKANHLEPIHTGGTTRTTTRRTLAEGTWPATWTVMAAGLEF